MLAPRRLVAPVLLLSLAACARAAASPVSVCRGRAESCSGHGDCAPQRRLQGRWACSCDPGYEGERCDIWRAPSRDLAELPPALRDVRWHNCTHGVERNGTLVQHCVPGGDESLCQAAGAPTVPAPNWDGICYRPPTMPNAQDDMVCNFGQPGPGVDSVAIVIHGVKGSFCAPPCQGKESASCTGCPAPCMINDTTSGKCRWCATHPAAHPGICKVPFCGGKTDHYPDAKRINGSTACSPCSGDEAKMVCPCPVPPDENGKPILATPQCVLTDCGDEMGYDMDPGGPLCALTCDPNAKVPAGRSNCQPGAVCEPVPNAAFSPAGLCTFPNTTESLPTSRATTPATPASRRPRAGRGRTTRARRPRAARARPGSPSTPACRTAAQARPSALT